MTDVTASSSVRRNTRVAVRANFVAADDHTSTRARPVLEARPTCSQEGTLTVQFSHGATSIDNTTPFAPPNSEYGGLAVSAGVRSTLVALASGPPACVACPPSTQPKVPLKA